MKAVIMAGGEGSRLRPMTCSCPKPMVPVMDKPVMAYALELLKRHGVTEAAVTLMYLPGRVTDYFGDGSDYGLRLTYYTENTPLGTAGSVKQAEKMLDETFVVLSGDGLTDCDLKSALAFHKEKKALATMVLKKVATPLEYGVVLTDSAGRVERFVEKPGWGEVCSDAVNTGIYLFEPEVLQYIPDNKPCDFGRELFPKLVEAGLPVYGYLMDGYWCDIGDTSAYLRANADMLDGKMALARDLRPGGVNRMAGAIVDKSAVLEAPCFIGSGARVAPGARIGPYTVLGAGAVVDEGAGVKRSVIWRGAHVGKMGQMRGTVLLGGAVTGADASAFEESVLGEDSMLGEGAVLMPGVKVWPHKVVADGERVDQNVVWGAGRVQRLTDGAFADCAPAEAVINAQAFAEALKMREVLVARDASAVALACRHAVEAGLMAQGVQVIDIGASTVAQTRFALDQCAADGAIHVSRDRMLPLLGEGQVLGREQARKVLGLIARADYAMPFSGVTKPPIAMGATDLGYVNALIRQANLSGVQMGNVRAAVYGQTEMLLYLCERAYRRAGISVRAEWEEELMELGPDEVGVWLGESGEKCDFADGQGMLTEGERTLLISWIALEAGEKTLVLPRGATHAAMELAGRYGVQVDWSGSGDAAFQAALLARAPDQFALHFDGIACSLRVLGCLARNHLSLRGAIRQFPVAHRHSQVIPMALKDKGRLLRMLAEALPEADLTDGVTLNREGGWAWISPCGDKRECVVVAESADAEFARELCDFCIGEVSRLNRQGDGK
ncbi:MAG: sugar phosphate nucleotidyltransferase [Clostridia bacterium]